MRSILLVILIFTVYESWSPTLSLRLSVETGTLNLNGTQSIPYRIFTQNSLTFSKNSDLLIWNTGDVITLKVVNNDLVTHGFVIEGIVNYGDILPTDSSEQTFTVSQNGVFRYFDPLNAPFNEYKWYTEILSGNSPQPNQYDPRYFTINGNSEPNIDLDPIARISGSVGEELRVVIVNNGLSIHSMHFHGYHANLLTNSKDPSKEGREKDTFPLYPKEHIVISILPDKPGEYPVHDHNLVAVTGGGIYHAGMLTTLMIAP